MPFEGLQVSDCMTTHVITIAPDEDVTRAVAMMASADVSGLMVVDGDGRLVGILTERDCIEAATAANYHGELAGPVDAFMSAPVETVTAAASLVEVALRMVNSPYRRFPVVDGDRLVGLLSRRDLMLALQRAAQPAASTE